MKKAQTCPAGSSGIYKKENSATPKKRARTAGSSAVGPGPGRRGLGRPAAVHVPPACAACGSLPETFAKANLTPKAESQRPSLTRPVGDRSSAGRPVPNLFLSGATFKA